MTTDKIKQVIITVKNHVQHPYSKLDTETLHHMVIDEFVRIHFGKGLDPEKADDKNYRAFASLCWKTLGSR